MALDVKFIIPMELGRGYSRYPVKTNITFKVQHHVSWEQRIFRLVLMVTVVSIV